MRHELALPARLPRAPQQRSVEALAAALRAFERRTPLVVWCVVGVDDSSKKIGWSRRVAPSRHRGHHGGLAGLGGEGGTEQLARGAVPELARLH